MVTVQQLTRQESSQVQTLDLSSSRPEKIHRIQSLERFTNLRSLNLANNMISQLSNLGALTQLRVLNVEFNQISRIEDLRGLSRLEELFASYNCIEQISAEIRANHRLRVMHLAYNDLKQLEDIRPLASLPNLTILSLVGNPFLAALNYLAFVKMLIPSLLVLDDRDASQSLISAQVYPHEEIFILREALNKLLDERNNLNNSDRNSPIKQAEASQMHGQSQASADEADKNPTFVKTGNEKQSILGTIDQWIASNQRKVEVKRQEISELSDSYTSRIERSRTALELKDAKQLQEKIKRYELQHEKGLLTADKQSKLDRMYKELEMSRQLQDEQQTDSRDLLQLLKAKETEYSKLKQAQQALRQLRQRIQSCEDNPLKTILAQLLYGVRPNDPSLKQLKPYLFEPEGILPQLATLKRIIFGEEADWDRIHKLQQFLGEKSLIEIINNLKEMGVKHKKERKKFEKERGKLIEKFETEAQELCDQWKELEREKWMLRNSRHLEQPPPTEDKLARVEAEERSRIMMLKKEKEHYELKLDQMRLQLDSLQGEFERKYKELEEFERFFEEFKREREVVGDLKDEIERTKQLLDSKQAQLMQIEQNVKELAIKEENLLERVGFNDRKCYEKQEELGLYEDKLKTALEKLRKTNDQFSLKNYQSIRMQDALSRAIEESRDCEKRIERSRSTLELYEEKLRNLNELETNKRNNLAGLEKEMEAERKRLKELLGRVSEAEEKLNRTMEASYQYQVKMQENKKSIESLSDINKTLADMMDRQNQLKRTNMELELANQHLTTLKNKLIAEVNHQYDDQDEDL